MINRYRVWGLRIVVGALMAALGIVQYFQLQRTKALELTVANLQSVASPRRGELSRSLPTKPIFIGDGPTKGSLQARIAVIEYSDYQCPYCSRFARTVWPKIEAEYVKSGKILFAFKDFPLESIHGAAFDAAVAARCAFEEGKFWQMHDQLFSGPRELDTVSLIEKAKIVGIDRAAFAACTSSSIVSRVRADVAGARELAITGTPTFFVGKLDGSQQVTVIERVAGLLSFERFAAILDRLIGETTSQ